MRKIAEDDAKRYKQISNSRLKELKRCQKQMERMEKALENIMDQDNAYTSQTWIIADRALGAYDDWKRESGE